MGGGSSTHNNYVNNQESYVSREFASAKRCLPHGQYNELQIKGKLREEYASRGNNGCYKKKDSWINDKTWGDARRK